MNEIAKRIAYLIDKFLREELSDQEKTELESWIAGSEGNRVFFEKLTSSDYLFKAVDDSDSEERSLQRTLEHIKVEKISKAKVVTLSRFKWPAAAAIILLLAGTAYLLTHNKKAETVAETHPKSVFNDKAPGKQGAILKLANGQEIVLDSAINGTLAQQGQMQVVNKNGKLIYAGKGKTEAEILYNILTTSKGQMYPVVLADNSRVWLNSASSIRFPVAFNGNERKVEISGEVYFEIAHDATKPFIVSVNGTEVKVLGTKFNVNAYKDEGAIRTTLLEGSVQVKAGVYRAVIKPGQQAQVSENSIKTINKVDVSKIIAWKNGYFDFDHDKLSDVARGIARWYNVDVVFEGNTKDIQIFGTIERSSNLSEFLKVLELLRVDGRIEGQKLILKAE